MVLRHGLALLVLVVSIVLLCLTISVHGYECYVCDSKTNADSCQADKVGTNQQTTTCEDSKPFCAIYTKKEQEKTVTYRACVENCDLVADTIDCRTCGLNGCNSGPLTRLNAIIQDDGTSSTTTQSDPSTTAKSSGVSLVINVVPVVMTVVLAMRFQ